MNDDLDVMEWTFSVKTKYEGIGCDTDLKLVTRTESLERIIEDFYYFLRGSGFKEKIIDEYIKVN